MNLPISSASHVAATAATGAAKLARSVADGLGRALDFDAILRGQVDERGDDSASRTDSPEDTIRDSLLSIGVHANPPIRIDVHTDGSLRLSGDHPRAAEIELHLSADAKVRHSIREMAQVTGETQLTIGPA